MFTLNTKIHKKIDFLYFSASAFCSRWKKILFYISRECEENCLLLRRGHQFFAPRWSQYSSLHTKKLHTMWAFSLYHTLELEMMTIIHFFFFFSTRKKFTSMPFRIFFSAPFCAPLSLFDDKTHSRTDTEWKTQSTVQSYHSRILQCCNKINCLFPPLGWRFLGCCGLGGEEFMCEIWKFLISSSTERMPGTP